jgi:hypothetical protein
MPEFVYRIHPAIGIARVGNSPERFFLGPEAAGFPPSLDEPDAPYNPEGSHRDSDRLLKRQGARFRIYEYERAGEDELIPVREVTSADATVTWSVHLANRKAFGRTITGLQAFRNKLITGAAQRRSRLIIDAGAQQISSGSRGPVPLDQGGFQGRHTARVPVYLGELRTDQAGRLVVLGGRGAAFSPTGHPIVDVFNNDDWCDDTSDGPVTATLRLNGAQEEVIIREPAWVIVAPPDFAPRIENVVSLYDVVYDVAAQIDRRLTVTGETPISFTRDVYPTLSRVSNMRWVTTSIGSTQTSRGHRPGQSADFLKPALFALLADNDRNPSSAAFQRRNEIFLRLREPDGVGGGDMPQLAEGDVPVRLSQQQYSMIARWAQGTFDADWPAGRPPDQAPDTLPLEQIPLAGRPAALDRAALHACTGAAFFPGIEAPRTMMRRVTYAAPFRVRLDPGPEPEFGPGKLTEELAIPWHTDFAACGQNWWPSQRPNNVLRAGGTTPQDWASGARTGTTMIVNWSKLGIVKREPGSSRYVEAERTL